MRKLEVMGSILYQMLMGIEGYRAICRAATNYFSLAINLSVIFTIHLSKKSQKNLPRTLVTNRSSSICEEFPVHMCKSI